MQFHVPQFIDIEDRIFGPFTLKQFIYVLGAIGTAFIFYSLFPLFIAILFIVPISGLALLLAFYQHNGRPFALVLQSALKYLLSGKLYLWRKEKTPSAKLQKTDISRHVIAQSKIPVVTEGKLDDLTWSVDVKSNIEEDKPLGEG